MQNEEMPAIFWRGYDYCDAAAAAGAAAAAAAAAATYYYSSTTYEYDFGNGTYRKRDL